MTKPRYSIRTVFAVVTVAAIGSAALANPTDLWASVVFSGTLGLLLFAMVSGVIARWLHVEETGAPG